MQPNKIPKGTKCYIVGNNKHEEKTSLSNNYPKEHNLRHNRHEEQNLQNNKLPKGTKRYIVGNNKIED